jgi:hypothetical protein
MANNNTVRRTLHCRFALAGTDPANLLQLMKAAAPFYETFGNARMRLMRNVDDPNRFIQIIEYDAPKSLEQNRQQIASDPRLQGYLQMWRTMLPGSVEMDVYQDVEE